MRAAVLTVSTSTARGDREDRSGPALVERLEAIGATDVQTMVVPDERGTIEQALRGGVGAGFDLILTTGGTGLTPDDMTPEATRAVLDREAPGFAEALRAASAPHTPTWMLSRGVSGVCERTLIVNFPGSPRAIEQTWPAIAEALPHAVALLRGEHAGPHPA